MKLFIRNCARALFCNYSRSSNKLNVRYASKYYKIDDNISGLNDEQKQVRKFKSLDYRTNIIKINHLIIDTY